MKTPYTAKKYTGNKWAVLNCIRARIHLCYCPVHATCMNSPQPRMGCPFTGTHYTHTTQDRLAYRYCTRHV